MFDISKALPTRQKASQSLRVQTGSSQEIEFSERVRSRRSSFNKFQPSQHASASKPPRPPKPALDKRFAKEDKDQIKVASLAKLADLLLKVPIVPRTLKTLSPNVIHVRANEPFVKPFWDEIGATTAAVTDSQTQQQGPNLQNGDFETIKFLGKGNFGQVHLVVHRLTGFLCARKTISKATIKAEGIEKQLFKELGIHGNMNHTNVIKCYGWFTDPQNVYVLVEYATEGDLFTLMKKQHRCEETQGMEIVRGVCDALSYIHNMGYIHRDVKPQNLLVQFGVIKMCDFGWATECSPFSMRSSYVGTPLYLSPELVQRRPYNSSVDVWAMGTLTFELLCGKSPFHVWSDEDLKMVVEKDFIVPDYIDMTEQCRDFLNHSMAKEPCERWNIDDLLRHPVMDKRMPTQTDFELFESAISLID